MINKISSSFNREYINLIYIAFKMLVNSKRKFIGMVIGATFSSFIIMLQPSIYQGVVDRVVSSISTVKEVDLWVMGVNSYAFEHPTFFSPMDIYRIRSVSGVQWATQLYRSWYTLNHLPTQKVLTWERIGVNPQTLIGLPETMIAGHRSTIRHPHSIVVDGYSLKQFETQSKRTIQIGDKMFEGKNNWFVTGITKPMRTYMIQPRMYVTSNHIHNLASVPSFILLKVKPSYNILQVAKAINDTTGYIALTPTQFISRASDFFRKKTPIIVGFIAIAIVGFIIGLLIMWQIFSNFVLTHLHQFGMLKMLGVSNFSLMNMVFFQAATIGGLGYFFGLLLTLFFGFIFRDSTIAFHLSMFTIFLGAIGSGIVVVFSSYFSILKVVRLDTVELCHDSN